MADIRDLIKAKQSPKGRLTIRIADPVRAKAEIVAKKNGLSLAQVVEAGLSLLFKQELKNEKQK
jgi:predicted HicB family RNase H-like nuclease